MEYDNTNRGALFRKKDKEGKQPDMTGNINIDGKEYWLSGWTQTSKAGDKYLSLSVQPKEEKTGLDAPDSTKDDLPF